LIWQKTIRHPTVTRMQTRSRTAPASAQQEKMHPTIKIPTGKTMHPEITPPGHLITAISINANGDVHFLQKCTSPFALLGVPIWIFPCPRLTNDQESK